MFAVFIIYGISQIAEQRDRDMEEASMRKGKAKAAKLGV